MEMRITYFPVLQNAQESCGLNLCLLAIGARGLVPESAALVPFFDAEVAVCFGGVVDILTFRETSNGGTENQPRRDALLVQRAVRPKRFMVL